MGYKLPSVMNLLRTISLICAVTLRSMEFHILIYLLSVDWSCRVHFDNSNVIKQKNGSFFMDFFPLELRIYQKFISVTRLEVLGVCVLKFMAEV